MGATTHSAMQGTELSAYTDGSCLGNPGPGGWAAILQYREAEEILSGHVALTTNNRMELTAAIEALKHINPESTVHLYTDSMYLKDGITKWVPNWERNGWRTSKRQAVKNQDLWRQLREQTKTQLIHWHWVKAHAQNEMNNRVDQIARLSSLNP